MRSQVRNFVALAALSLASPESGATQGRPVEMCTVTKSVLGGYAFEHRPDLNVRSETSRPGPFRLVRPENVIGVQCLRERLVPQPLDLKVLQAGYDFSISDTSSELRLITLKLQKSRISWELAIGRITRAERAAVDRAVRGMQDSLGRLSRAPS
jgi:hypothetical protein